MDGLKVTEDIENRTLTIEKVFNAPIERVWDAYTQQEQFVKWWGPEGWETTVKEFSVTPGGRNHYGMKCVDKNQAEWYGQESWGLMVYEAVDAPNSLTFGDYFTDAEGNIDETKPVTKSTYEFIDEGDKTRLIARTVTETPEQLQELLNMGMLEGTASSLTKLNDVLQG